MINEPVKGSSRAKFIRTVIGQSKIAHELFGVPVRSFEELYTMKMNDLRNLESELRVQIGIKRSFSFKCEGA